MCVWAKAGREQAKVTGLGGNCFLLGIFFQASVILFWLKKKYIYKKDQDNIVPLSFWTNFYHMSKNKHVTRTQSSFLIFGRYDSYIWESLAVVLILLGHFTI